MTPARAALVPRLGFLGVGWIGRHRMQAIRLSGYGLVAAVSDPSPDALQAARAAAPEAAVAGSLDDLLAMDLDGIVLATPSALHAEQSVRALEHGLAVFCQKPLARTAAETWRVIDAARAADRLLAVDLSYRFTAGMQRVRELVRGGELGEVYAAELVFHNAYGPDKAWFHDPRLSGGGCVIDLGVHLVDLALWTLDFPAIEQVSSRLYRGGVPLGADLDVCEDYAVARLDLATGASARLACSWNLPAGQPAAIEATFYGTRGGARFRNVNGSFYDFVAERLVGTECVPLVAPPDEWGGRAAVDWARRVSVGERYDPAAAQLVDVSSALDAIYGRQAAVHAAVGRTPEGGAAVRRGDVRSGAPR